MRGKAGSCPGLQGEEWEPEPGVGRGGGVAADSRLVAGDHGHPCTEGTWLCGRDQGGRGLWQGRGAGAA